MGKFKEGEHHGAAKINLEASKGDEKAIEKKKTISKKISMGLQASNEKRRAEIQLYDTIRETLIDNGDYAMFLKKFIEGAKKDPNSTAGRKLADILLNEETIKSLDSSYDKIMARDQDFLEYRILKHFFKEQILVLLDHTSRYIFLDGGRRSGKTQVISGLISQQASKPNSRIVYIHRRFESAIRQMFDLVKDLSENVELNIRNGSKSSGTLEWENGSQMIFMGNTDITSFDRLRGEKFDLIIIDEAAFQKNLKIGINEVIEPTMLDNPRSRLILSSTPPRAPHHYSEKLHDSTQFKKFTWDFRDNPIITNKEEFINKLCAEKGITPDASYIQREYYNKWGLYDVDAQVFKTRLYFENLDFVPNEIIGGIDYGEQAYNAIILMAYNTFKKEGRVIYEDKFNRSNLTEFEAKLKVADGIAKSLIKQHNLNEERFAFYVDTNEPIISNELSTKGYRVFPAYKHDKQFAIEQLADALRKGIIKIKKGSHFDQEAESILWPRDDSTDAIIYNKGFDEDQGIHPDVAMAILYASRQFFWDCGLDGGAQVKEKETRYVNIMAGQ